jgi:hypothetical protein
MIIPSKFYGYNKDGTRNLFMGGGGGGGPTQTTSTVQNTNIPSYAQPYVESMLGGTIKQLFNTTETGGTAAVAPTYDSEGNQLTAGTAAIPGTINIDTFKPYQAYGGTYDQNKTLPDGTPNPNYGNQLSYDPSKGIAKIDPMQTKAYMGVAGMQTPTGDFANANYAATQAGLGGLNSAKDAMRFGEAGFASGQKGQELGIAGGQLGIAGGQKYGEMGAGFGQQAAGLASPALAYGAQGAGYGQTGAGYGAQAAQLANTALGYGQGSADIGKMALRAQGMGEGISGQSQDYARQQAGAGAQYARMATDPRVTEALMNPYTKNVLDVQNEELNRQGKIAAQARGAQAVRAGAFGGGRQAIENAEAERNLATLKNANTAQAYQQAFQNAQAQQQFGANLNLQGLSGAQQGLGTALQGGQLGLSGLGTALQGQQGALAGVGQAGSMYGLGMQGAQTGIQGTQAGLAGVGAANQAYQTGIQGAGMGLQGVNTQLAGVDRQLAGTAQGMQGAQVGLQGVSGAQAGYGLANQSASNLTNMLGQQQQQQLGLANAQMAMGDKKMAYDQSILNQAVQDYANAQQYPLMQLGTMSNMLRGLPMQASTTNQYAASPNPLSQAVGTIGAGASIYNAMKPGPGGAAGGEVKGYAKGGIMSYDMGGEVEEQLESMDEKGLEAQAKQSSSPSIRKMAQRLLRERQMSKQPQGTGPMGVQYQAAQPQMPSYAPGGIVAFQQGAGGNGVKSAIEEGGEEDARRIDLSGKTMDQRLAMPPTTEGGIMGATTQPATQVPAAPAGPSPDVVKEAMRQRDLASAQANRPTAELLKEIQAERDALGVGENVGRQEFRAQQMAERANLADEKERQRHMRLAEFFASWGSTPGPVLVAGMNALKQSIPGIISDEKEAKKARKEADKIIYDIDEATRLEKLGMIDKATAKKEQAAKHAEDYNKYLLTFQSQRESDKRALEQTAMTTEAQRYVADSQAKSQSGYNAQRAKETEYRNIEVSLNAALRQKADIEKDIEATRSRPPKGSPLAKAMDTANLYNSLLSKNNGDASKLDAITRKNGEQALETINKFETNAARRLREAENRVQTFENLFDTAGRGSKSGAKTSGSKDDPFEIMDILKSESPASAASADAPTKTSANAPAAAPAAAPATNSLALKIDKETNELGAGTRKAYSPDVQEYFDKLKAERKVKEAAYLKQQQQQMLTPLR